MRRSIEETTAGNQRFPLTSRKTILNCFARQSLKERVTQTPSRGEEGFAPQGVFESIHFRNKAAFTLAEVLITLGIIGIVAAMTIPTLISTYKKKVVEGRLVKFYSTMNQAIKLSEVENGTIMQWDVLTGGYDSDDENETDYKKSYTYSWFIKYLAPYLRISEIKTSSQTNGAIMLYFPDGSVCLFGRDSVTFWPVAADYNTIEDSDGLIVFNKGYSGTKCFSFFFNPWSDKTSLKYHYEKGVEPYMGGWDGTVEKLLTDSSIGCRETVSNTRAYCTKLIQMNGWKIPDDYPLKF